MQEDREGVGEGADQPPIIIKKVVVAAGHHGGAWKVAFADFVTAMMALFMVMWLMAAKDETRDAIAGYFNDPKGFGEKYGSGESLGGITVDGQSPEELAKQIQEAMEAVPEFAATEEQIAMSLTAEGLRIELLENEKGTFFQSGSPTPSRFGQETLTVIGKELAKLPNHLKWGIHLTQVGQETPVTVIGKELAKLPNHLIIEGHTDSRPFRGRRSYSNWELSVDRANSARRLLLANGLISDRIVGVRGFADVQLRNADDPKHPSNRRISLIVKYDDQPVPFAGGFNEGGGQDFVDDGQDESASDPAAADSTEPAKPSSPSVDAGG